MKKYFDGEKLKALRKSRKLSGQEVANRVNLSQSYLSQFENGHSIPDIDILGSILEVLNSDLPTFLSVNREDRAYPSDVYEFIEIYDQLTTSEQKLLMTFLRQFVSKG